MFYNAGCADNSGIMADYASATTNLEGALGDDVVEEYETGNGKVRVKRGKLADQVKALALLDGLASRGTSGLLRLGKFQEPSD